MIIEQKERLAVVALASVVAEFPFLADQIDPLIVKLVTKGTVTPEIVKIGLEEGRGLAAFALRKLYFNQMNFTEANEILVSHFKKNGLEFKE